MLQIDTMGISTPTTPYTSTLHLPITSTSTSTSTRLNKRRNSDSYKQQYGSGSSSNSASMMSNTPSPNKIMRVSSEEFTSSSSSTRNATSSSSTTTTTNMMKLVVASEPHAYPFINVWFPITVNLLDENNELLLNHQMRVSMELYYGDGEICNELNVLQIHPSTPLMINQQGEMTLQVRFLQLGSVYANKGIMFKFSTGLSYIQSCYTIPFTTVTYRMKIIEQPPTLVYKDTPLRSFVVKALLVDQNDMIVRTNDMPLDILLCYADTGLEVPKQSILYKLGSKLAKLDNGTVDLKLRIDEVSKNHNGREFTIRIRPSAGAANDIAPDTTTPIDVKSRPRRSSKNNAHFSMNHSATTTNTHNTQAENLSRISNEISDWCNLAFSSLLACEWQYERTEDPNTGKTAYILRCPVCGATYDNNSSTHAENCTIATTKQRYAQVQNLLFSFSSASTSTSHTPSRDDAQSPHSANTTDTTWSNEVMTDRDTSSSSLTCSTSSASSSAHDIDWYTSTPITSISKSAGLASSHLLQRTSSIESLFFKLNENATVNIAGPSPYPPTESAFAASPVFDQNMIHINSQPW